MQSPILTASPTDSMFDAQDRYVMHNFDKVRPMSNFLNGLGGIWGIPMWAFYVNRGQGITSFGKQNKDNAIAKFVTAEKAYFQTPYTGFRTFLKGKRGSSESFNYMPFFPRAAGTDDSHLKRDMIIGANEMEIEEVNDDLQLQTNVLYFIAPEQDFPTLVRSATFTNLDSHETLDMQVLDGLGQLIPNGLGNNVIDAMGRTMEAWMNVYNVGAAQSEGAEITQPYFHISQDTADSTVIRVIRDGYFAISYIDQGSKPSTQPDGLRELLPFVVDPSLVFGTDTTLSDPSAFFKFNKDVKDFVTSPQGTTSRTPCAFAGAKVSIPPRANVTITSIYGYADSLETFIAKYSPVLRDAAYSTRKREAADKLVETITDRVGTSTGSEVFDAYVRQDFLDNVLRGGLPLKLGQPGQEKVFHVYSRIHGDIERDYNYFQIDTTYFSQGPGNFRDVCQNRRVDVFHTPAVGDFNLRLFLSFIQADGYNPLTIASTIFKVTFEKIEEVVKALQVIDSDNSGNAVNTVKDTLRRSFRPGQFFRDMDAAGVKFAISKDQVIAKLVSSAKQDFAGQFSQNGYWADHWTYILDILDNYLVIFPDQEQHVLWDSEPVPFFMSPAIVKSRTDRYSLVNNPAKPGTNTIRIYKPIAVWGEPEFSTERVNAMNAIYTDPNYLVDPNGAAGVWQRARDSTVFKVSAITKFLMLGILKFSSLDPYGMGVEMEGGKPGWNDAMNGLPGTFGSGMAETFEMLRILSYTKGAIKKFQRSVQFPVEFSDFITHVVTAIDAFNSSPKDKQAEFNYWDANNNARESYRDSIVATFRGVTTDLTADYLVQVLEKMEVRVRYGITNAIATSPSGLTPTYFYYECVDFTVTGDAQANNQKVAPKAFDLRTLPLFLEGPTRYMKVLASVEERRHLYQLVRNSPMYDEALQMYTLCESLASMGQDVGRMKAFSAGWLENQSVWLHMSYKFYLELLRGGLYEEFFQEILTGLVPFMDNKVYGRSPLEAASFIVSSAFPDKKLHGASFLARLSGSTAEFLSMWAYMMAGPQPFVVNQFGSLQLALNPILPSWLFNAEGKASFIFLGEVNVTYVNPTKTYTWKIKPSSAQVTLKSGEVINDDDAVLDERLTRMVRESQVSSIVIKY